MKANNITIIGIDAMGGDHAPEVPVKAAASVSLTGKAFFYLIGDKKKLEPLLTREKHDRSLIKIIHTDDFIADDEFPRNIIRQKKKASLNIATEMCGKDDVDSVVSAGNTGAYMLSALKNVPRIPALNKVAIISVFPTRKFLKTHEVHKSLILDVGANNSCNAEDLQQFAVMGKNYYTLLTGKKDPEVFLLNIGHEAHKGGDVLVNAHRQLQSQKHLKFRGNIESNKIFTGQADVIVCDGFTGNVILKTIEGMVESVLDLGRHASQERFLWKAGLFLLSGGIKKIRPLLDYSEYGGAPILGFKKILIKAHGRSDAKAFANAINIAIESHKKELIKKITKELDSGFK
jgi:glycerol-3-phosphate acyltransferase PlsX